MKNRIADYFAVNRNTPNKVQLEFMRLCAERYYYTAFGDTNHGHTEIPSFMFDPETISVLSKAGKKGLFTERGEPEQRRYDAYRQEGQGTESLRDRLMSSTAVAYLTKPRRAWTYGQVKGIEDNIRQSVKENPDIDFVAIDKRQSFVSGLIGEFKIPLSMPVHMLTSTVSSVRSLLQGNVRESAHKAMHIMSMNGLVRAAKNTFMNDEKPASEIKASESPAAIFYGAGHFIADTERQGERTSLSSLLPEEDKTLCVLNICKSETEGEYDKTVTGYLKPVFDFLGLRRSELGREIDDMYNVSPFFNEARLPDARLYVQPSADNPHGIEILNPDFEELYAKAVENVEGQVLA